MDTVSSFMAFYTWVKDPNFVTDIGKTIVGGAAYDIFKTLGTSFVSKVYRFFSSEEEAKRYFEQVCIISSTNTKEPYRDLVTLFENLSTNKFDEQTRQQFIEVLKKWFTDNSLEINKLIGEIKPDKSDRCVDNFINVYKNHGIQKEEIITVIPSEFGLKEKDFKNKESISAIIDRDLLEWTSSRFGVQLKWLCGTTPFIYSVNSYPTIQALFNLILYIKFVKEENVEAYLFKSGKLDCFSEKSQCLALILKVSNHKFYRYIPIGKQWNWGWLNSRYDIKHVIYFFERIGIYVSGYEADSNIITSLFSGTVFFEQIIKNKKETWCPDNYIDLPLENISAQETHETQKCRDDFYYKEFIKYISMEIDRIISNEGYRQCVRETVLSKF